VSYVICPLWGGRSKEGEKDRPLPRRGETEGEEGRQKEKRGERGKRIPWVVVVGVVVESEVAVTIAKGNYLPST
jgi:hypothetical protein